MSNFEGEKPRIFDLISDYTKCRCEKCCEKRGEKYRKIECSTCDGSGFKDHEVCPECDGSGTKKEY